MRILLLGGSGFVGRHLLELCEGDPRSEVIAPKRSELDFRDFNASRQALAAIRPDAVINAAGGLSIGKMERAPLEAESLNHHAPAWWAGECDKRGIKFVHYSTDQVFDGLRLRPYTENDLVSGVSVYGKSKAHGETAVAQYPSALIIRTSFVFGVGGNGFMSQMPHLLLESNELNVVSDIKASCVHVNTLSSLTVELVRMNASGIVNVVNKGAVTWPDFAFACIAEFRKRGIEPKCAKLKEISFRSLIDTLGPRATYSVLSTTKLEALVGGQINHWKDEIPRFLEAFQAIRS